jgi:hypothetical protein
MSLTSNDQLSQTDERGLLHVATVLTAMTTRREVVAPLPVVCVVDHLHRDLGMADAARRAGVTHSGIGLDLAHAYTMTADRSYLHAWEDLVEAFCDRGDPNEATEATAGRLQTWLYSWRRFADAPHFVGLRPGLAERITQRIAADAEHLRHDLTDVGTRRTLELYTLLIVGLSLPDGDADLARFALAELGHNLMADFSSDGVHRDCSIDAHCTVLRSHLGAIANARAAGLDLPDGYVDRVSLAADFALHIQRPDGSTPSCSDGDVRGLLALAAGLLKRDYLRWAATGGFSGSPPACANATFPVGGYVTARSGWGKGATPYVDERFMLMRAGGSDLCGDCDQLTVELHADGHPFVGSELPNTVTVDGLDRDPGLHARLVRRTSAYDFDAIEAEATSPQQEVTHTRRVMFPGRDYWVVHDHLDATRSHRYEARWYLPAGAEGHTEVERSSQQTTVRTPAGCLVIPASAGVQVDVEPGWVSPSAGDNHSGPVVVVLCAQGATADIVTVLSPGLAAVTVEDDTIEGRLRCCVGRGTSADCIEWSTDADVVWNRRRTQP